MAPAAFSGTIRAADLNDYIAPSQACVVSLKGKRLDLEPSDKELGKVQVHSKAASQQKAAGFSQTKLVGQSEAIKVSLHDCLACSGCVTSAETVLLEQQSTGEFLARLQDSSSPVVVSLSPQSRASLAAHYGLTSLQAFKKVTGFMKSLGVRAVYDTSCSRDISLMECCEEFVARFQQANGERPMDAPLAAEAAGPLPMLASACPGWVCYAEKTHGTFILPYISTAKSPQQVMGMLVKRQAAGRLGLRPEELCHVSIMPCYDKKLEAARDDFIFALPDNKTADAGGGAKVHEVDCVLTSGEIHGLLEEQGVDFASLPEHPLDKMLSNVGEEGHLYGVTGGSGGYADCIFRHAAKVLFGQDVKGPLDWKVLRNQDFRELTLEVDGNVVLRFACAYGFRNIQTLVRRIKEGRSKYHFVEIMACPGGCLSGGGQIKPRKGRTTREILQDIETAYLQGVDVRDPAENPVAQALYSGWLGHPYSPLARELLHTQYHHREKRVEASLDF